MVLLAQLRKNLPVSPADLYQFVSDMENYKIWFPGVVDIRSIDDLAVGVVGKRYLEVLEMPTGSGELIIEVKQAVPNSRLMTEGDLPQLLPRMTIDIAPEGHNDSQLTLTYESRNDELEANTALVEALRRDLRERASTGLQTLDGLVARGAIAPAPR